MYRQMTPEEKLEYSAEVIEAIKKDGLEGSLRVVSKYQKLLYKKDVIENPPLSEETPILMNEPEKLINNSTGENLQEASIYAPEHIPAVQDDLREQGLIPNDDKKNAEQPKTKVLEQSRSIAPNPWGDADVVSPGQLNL